ncbi:hypothetical protein FF38_02862 [Lucilia cuprina]|uniref:Uncharacterized protein n=1 Tax=Lucilia cuprina TaxID=7375 RepID=A0A0L0CQ85_LUCCU|nr:hypothetical protein FF38_02862 [Lucilia cuprina]
MEFSVLSKQLMATFHNNGERTPSCGVPLFTFLWIVTVPILEHMIRCSRSSPINLVVEASCTLRFAFGFAAFFAGFRYLGGPPGWFSFLSWYRGFAGDLSWSLKERIVWWAFTSTPKMIGVRFEFAARIARVTILLRSGYARIASGLWVSAGITSIDLGQGSANYGSRAKCGSLDVELDFAVRAEEGALVEPDIEFDGPTCPGVAGVTACSAVTGVRAITGVPAKAKAAVEMLAARHPRCVKPDYHQKVG